MAVLIKRCRKVQVCSILCMRKRRKGVVKSRDVKMKILCFVVIYTAVENISHF